MSHDDGDRIASASFYSNKDAAFAASTVIDVWVRMHARQLLPDPPQVFLGECFFHKARDLKRQLRPLRYTGVAGWWRWPDA